MIPSLLQAALLGALLLDATTAASHRRHHDILARKQARSNLAFRFPYASEQVKGVNLGGWLVLEPFITPSIFNDTGNPAIVDEYTFCKYQDYQTAHTKLERHWSTWITESDLLDIKAAGLNHVRIPIGFWAFFVDEDEPYHKGALKYLQLAVQWAQSAGLSVWIDLHGAPGSQNGFDNSGQRMDYPTWHTNQRNVNRTDEIIKALANEFAQDKYPHVTAIAALNEPAGYRGQDVLNVTRQYWYDSYGNIRYPVSAKSGSDLIEVIHDAFQPLPYWKDFMPASDYQGVILDTHLYEVFSVPEEQRSWNEHIASVCSKGEGIKSFTTGSGSLWTVVGEWSLAAYDCAPWLNGRGVGSRYDGSYPGSTRIGDCGPFTGDGAHFSPEYKSFLRKFWEAQTTAYSGGNGWIYWTWKTENADEWSYSAGLRHGWIPSNPDQKMFANPCK